LDPPNPSYLEPPSKHASLHSCPNLGGSEESLSSQQLWQSSVLYTATSTCFFFPLPLLLLLLLFLFSFSFFSSSPSFFFSLFLLLFPQTAATRCSSTSFFVVICCLLLQLQQTRQPRRGAPLLAFFRSHVGAAITPPTIRSTRGACRPYFSL
jgi:hypothetical protein